MKRTVITLFLTATTYLASGYGPTPPAGSSSNGAWWRSQGHGLLLSEDEVGLGFDVYEETAISRLWSYDGRFQGGFLYVDGQPEAEVLEHTATALVIRMGDGTRVRFDRIAGPPSVRIVDATDNPEANFEVFWHTIEEQCSVLTLAGVDWHAAYDTYRPKIRPGTRPKELFRVLGKMIAQLNDGHSYVEDPERDRFAGSGPDAEYIWMNDRVDEVLEVVEHEADGRILYSELEGAMRYGTFDCGRYGYLWIQRLDEFSDEDNTYENAAVFAAAVDRVLASLAATEALIVDVRANEGGDDNVGLELVERLISEPMVAWYKQARVGGYDELEERQLRHVEPDGVPYLDRLVIVLTTDAIFSAGETLVLALRELPQVVQIGTPTYGIFSNTLDRMLPNGWYLTTSNERYSSNLAIDYEQKGVAPHIRAESSPEYLNRCEDPVLELALAELERRRLHGTLGFPLFR